MDFEICGSMNIKVSDRDLYHVHTWRCRHAFDGVSDEDVVKKAIEIGAESIYFTDHGPFPGDPFGNRMRYDQLDEYLWTLDELRRRYKDNIKIYVGLEIEYLPSYANEGYYESLLEMPGMDFLMLGQHFAEVPPDPDDYDHDDDEPTYTFAWDKTEKYMGEYKLLADAECDGIKSGYFAVVAHPDRIFRYYKRLTDDMIEKSKKIIEAADKYHVVLEKNVSSLIKDQYSIQFWSLVPDNIKTIIGLDAHTLDMIVLPKNLSSFIKSGLKD